MQQQCDSESVLLLRGCVGRCYKWMLNLIDECWRYATPRSSVTFLPNGCTPKPAKNHAHVIYLQRFCLTLIGLLIAPTLSAHSDKASFQRYKAAKSCYAAADYATAREMLEPLIHAEERDDLTPYVLFYYALAAYHDQEPALAARTWKMLLQEFPDWKQQEEVWYWLGQLRLEAKDYEHGLAYLAQIASKKLVKSARQMKIYFLRQVKETATLQALLRIYPEDTDIAQILFDKLAQQPLVRRDVELLDLLARDFNLTLKEHDLLQNAASSKKDSYNVAVFLPFFVSEVDHEAASSGSFVIALYQGIKAAVTALAEQDIQIKLFAYDTKKDAATTAALLEQPAMKDMDLIIGPLYPATTLLVTEFARAHKINVFNPLSENAEVVGNNPFVFLSKPSLATQARKAAEFTLQGASTEAINVGIIYGETLEDAIPAHAYKQYIERKIGREVTLMLPIDPEEAKNFLHELRELIEKEQERKKEKKAKKEEENEGEEEEEESELLTKLGSLTHIYVASKDALIAANVLGAVEMLKMKPLIIGHEKWLEKGALTLDELQRLRLRLVAPDYINYKKPGIHDFRNNFYEQFAQYPGYHACKSYELMCFLGHMLDQYGVYFQQHWQTRLYPGTIFEGANYGIHHDNQHVPILQLRKGEFIICNQVQANE